MLLLKPHIILLNMESFNIKISYGTNEVTLTILPTDNDYYKVIYYGGVLGAVCFDGNDWEAVAPENLEAGDLPFYEPGRPGERIEIELTDHVIDRIGWEIRLSQS